MNRKKEAAKFFSGFATMQVLGHGSLAVSGLNYIVFGITLSTRYNMLAVVFWVIVLILLVYYAWIKK